MGLLALQAVSRAFKLLDPILRDVSQYCLYAHALCVVSTPRVNPAMSESEPSTQVGACAYQLPPAAGTLHCRSSYPWMPFQTTNMRSSELFWTS